MSRTCPNCEALQDVIDDLIARNVRDEHMLRGLLSEWLEMCGAAGLGPRSVLTQRTLDALFRSEQDAVSF